MATAVQLFNDRATAGAAYAAALEALQAAWIDLRALDLACGNRNVLQAHPSGGAKEPVLTFANASQWNADLLRHPVYAAYPYPSLPDWERTAQLESLNLIASHTEA